MGGEFEIDALRTLGGFMEINEKGALCLEGRCQLETMDGSNGARGESM